MNANLRCMNQNWMLIKTVNKNEQFVQSFIFDINFIDKVTDYQMCLIASSTQSHAMSSTADKWFFFVQYMITPSSIWRSYIVLQSLNTTGTFIAWVSSCPLRFEIQDTISLPRVSQQLTVMCLFYFMFDKKNFR